MNALLLINLIEAGSVILVAFVAFANALAFTVVTLYVTPFTLTVAETVTLLPVSYTHLEPVIYRKCACWTISIENQTTINITSVNGNNKSFPIHIFMNG